MPSVTIPTFSTPAPLAASMTVDDVAVAQRARAHDEHRLLLALLEDVAEAIFELAAACTGSLLIEICLSAV